MFTRGGTDRPRTIAEAARDDLRRLQAVFAWPFGTSGAHRAVRCCSTSSLAGKIGRSPEADLVERYLKRIAWPTKVTELPERGGKMPDLAAKQRYRRAR